MQTIEIDDIAVARRCRMAQYMGRETKLILNGSNIHCWVKSVMDVPGGNPKSWAITIEPTNRKPVLSWKPQANR